MALGAVLGTAIAGLSPAPRKYGLFVAGLDVAGYVGLETVRVTEAGPGDVSQLTFTVDDDQGVVPTPGAGSEIQLWDLALGYPLFAGYLNDYKVRPYGLGRSIEVVAFGLEALLDWSVSGDQIPIGVPSGLSVWLPVQMSLLANQVFPQARLIAPDPELTGLPASLRDGNATWPIASLAITDLQSVSLQGGTGTMPRGSFRSWIEYWSKYGGRNNAAGTAIVPVNSVGTVDFYRRLRIWEAGREPADYSTLVVNDTAAGPLRAADLEYEVHPGDVARAVYVAGASAAGSGLFYDGSGILGKTALLNDGNAATLADAQRLAAEFFTTQAILVRGSFTLEDYTPDGTVHAGSLLTLTDVQVSQAAQQYVIASIDKTFAGPYQTWRVRFGGRPPSIVETIRTQYSAATTFSSSRTVASPRT